MGLFSKSAPPAASPSTATTTPPTNLNCSFCGKSQREVRKLIAGPSVYICDECLKLSNQIIDEEDRAKLPAAPDAATLFAALEERVVGAVRAKRVLIAALRQHFHRAHHDDSTLRVPRVLLVGSRGTGKTTLARALCAVSKLPSCHADVTRLSESGYVGDDVENFLASLLPPGSPADAVAHRGVIFLDGLEKIRAMKAPAMAPRDISGEGVQRELLRLMDGLVLQVNPFQNRHPQVSMLAFPCAGLFIAGIATLEEDAAPPGADDRTLRAALEAIGLLPEFLARFDTIVRVSRLTEHEMADILERRGGPLEQARAMITALGGRLEVSAGAVHEMAVAAARDPDGAWSLTRPIQRYMEEILNERSASGTWIMDEMKSRALLGMRL